MPSLNLPADPRIPQVVHRLAEDAEGRLRDDADIAALRVRQLLEAFVLSVENAAGVNRRGHESLHSRIGDLSGLPPTVKAYRLQSIRKSTNEAVHIGRLNLRPQGTFYKSARDALREMLDVWRAWADLPPLAELNLPPAPDARQRELDRLHGLLDRAEHLADQVREWDQAEALLAAVDLDQALKAGAQQADIDLVALRRASIERAAANHRGLSPPPMDRALAARIASSGGGRALDELVHLFNREAVSALNRLDFATAEARLAEVTEWREAASQFLPSELQLLPVRDWQLGALLGTRGQLRAFQAHARRDLALLREALDDFASASACFTHPADLDRQTTYRLHALVEVVRLGGELTADELNEVQGLVESAPHKSVKPGAWHPDAFRVAACLKTCEVLSLRPSWLNDLQKSLERLPEEPLDHPYGQLVGWLMRLMPHPPRSLGRAMRATAERGKDPLGVWVAACFLADSSVPEVPAQLKDWWRDHDMGTRAESEGAAAILPFYVA